ncbi:hypothetical protein TrCOL_g6690 [Triparma columacea]|uniref:Uncharacterized protein n=1 Tax=Triparma columacea TaxID=722753 RepID=A0A9W7GQJ4_9STRA|nr:hypothetical protein TrCOL_g6690 [Triparma columacea]
MSFLYMVAWIGLIATVSGSKMNRAKQSWGRVEFLRYRDYCIRLEGGMIACFDHDEEVDADGEPAVEATFRDNEGNIISPEEEEEEDADDYGQPLDLELPDNPFLTNIPLQLHYDGLLLSGYSCSDPPSPSSTAPSSSSPPHTPHPSSPSLRCILPGSILCPIIPSRRSNAILDALHSVSWRAIRSVENTLAEKVIIPEEAILLRGAEEGVQEGDDWVEFLSSICLVRRGGETSVYPIPPSVMAGDELLLLRGCNSSPSHRTTYPTATVPTDGGDVLSVLYSYCKGLNPFPNSPPPPPSSHPLCLMSKDGEYGFPNGIRARIWKWTGDGWAAECNALNRAISNET